MNKLKYIIIFLVISIMFSCYTDDYIGTIPWNNNTSYIDSANYKYTYKTIFDDVYFSSIDSIPIISNIYSIEDSIKLNIKCEYDKNYCLSEYTVTFVNIDDSRKKFMYGPWTKYNTDSEFHVIIKTPKQQGKYAVTIFCKDLYLRDDNVYIRINNQFESDIELY